jgi:predicted NBD/HSP70 family sugar kinase/predicted transcriptional regulator
MRLSSVTQQVSGSNQVGVRQYNERVILSLIRENGALTKAEIAKATNLTPQTAASIINRLCAQDLLIAGTKRRGGVGQPSTPYSLNPDGAYSIGIKIGRASTDILFMDFTGQVRTQFTHEYEFPTPNEVFTKIQESIFKLTDTLSPLQLERCTGIGVAAPFALDGWSDELVEARNALRDWAKVDILHEVRKRTRFDVSLINDATAACLAEITFGNPQAWSNIIYIYVGTFIGGGVVMNGQIWNGSHSNAGAIGSLPTVNRKQLIHKASLHQLDKTLKEHNLSANFANLSASMGEEAWNHFTAWADSAAKYIADAVAAGTALLDPDGIIIDGRLPKVATNYLVSAVNAATSETNWEGLEKPSILAGHLGFEARAKGGALLPIYSNFGLDNQAFLKAAG